MKTLKKKLQLNRETIATLNDQSLAKIKGGEDTRDCASYTTCQMINTCYCNDEPIGIREKGRNYILY